MAPDKGQDGASARRGRAKDDNAVVVSLEGMTVRLRYLCPEREKNPLLAPNVLKKDLVRSAGQSLVRNQVRIVPHVAKVIANFSGEILVDLEFHVA